MGEGKEGTGEAAIEHVRRRSARGFKEKRRSEREASVSYWRRPFERRFINGVACTDREKQVYPIPQDLWDRRVSPFTSEHDCNSKDLI